MVLVRLIKNYDDKNDAHEILHDAYSPHKQTYTPSDHLILLEETLETLKKSGNNPQHHLVLLQRILNFLIKFNMGKEWVDTLMILCVLGKLSAPSCNFSLGIDVRGKRVLLRLNPDTSLEDLEACFKQIRQKQIELQPKFKKIKYTKKSKGHFFHDFFVDTAKYYEADLKNQEMVQKSEFATIIYKKKTLSIKQKEREINKHRKQLKKKPLYLTQKVSDVELANKLAKRGAILSANKFLNKIRQERRRLKNNADNDNLLG